MTTNKVHAAAYRFFDALPWMLLWIYGFLVEQNSWLAAIGFVGAFRRLLTGWEYPLPTLEKVLERRARRMQPVEGEDE